MGNAGDISTALGFKSQHPHNNYQQPYSRLLLLRLSEYFDIANLADTLETAKKFTFRQQDGQKSFMLLVTQPPLRTYVQKTGIHKNSSHHRICLHFIVRFAYHRSVPILPPVLYSQIKFCHGIPKAEYFGRMDCSNRCVAVACVRNNSRCNMCFKTAKRVQVTPCQYGSKILN
jgi:hypothetical protein